MSQADRDKWEARYREGAYADRTHPSALVSEWLPKLDIDVDIEATQPRALDIACGAGRNAIHLARRGWRVDALDISQVALDRLAAQAAEERVAVVCMQADLEDLSRLPPALASEQYALAVVIRYTNLPLIARLERALEPGGYLIAEEHLQLAEPPADVVGPRNPRFRVAPGALRAAAAGLVVIEYREGIVEEPDGRIAALAQLIARKRQ